ncbi:MAG: hypothetical protein KDK99_17655, partial [Verrucomicrobiales bacterium]|nr:hypothetical protein [Verrucomicrobiales bacterium]
NPLRHGPPAEFSEPHLVPLVALLRTEPAEDLLGFSQGLRHAPAPTAMPLLRRLTQLGQAEVLLYAQNTAQALTEHLHSRLQALDHALRTGDLGPHRRADLLETALHLSHPAILPATERPSWLPRLRQWAELCLADPQLTPRLRAAAVRAFIETGDFSRARQELRELDAGCPLRLTLEQSLDFRAHRAGEMPQGERESA